MGFLKFIIEKTMKPIEDRLERIESRQRECDLKHEGHTRRHDDAAKNHAAQTKLLERIAERLDGFEKTVTRTANNYTTFDTLLRWAGGGTVAIGFITAAIVLILQIKGLF